MVPAANHFPLAYMTSYGARSKSLPIGLYDVIWCPQQIISHWPIGRHMVPAANHFPLAYRMSYDAHSNALPIYLQDVLWCP